VKFVIWSHDKSHQLKSNPNQLTFLNQIFPTQDKSTHVIRSWFKSNNNLDLPITAN